MKKGMQVELGSRQKELQKHVSLDDIPSGARIPNHLFQILTPPATIVDFGGGKGFKAHELRRIGYTVVVADINPEAITHALSFGLPALEVDITEISTVDSIRAFFSRNVDAVVMEALLCNLVGNDWQKALRHAHELLKEEGLLFIADVLRVDQPNPLLDVNVDDTFLVWRRDWEERYRNNTQLGLPWGTFVVARPGVNKSIEYGPPELLTYLVGSDNFERYALHLNEIELIDYCASIGFEVILFEYMVWQSRENKPLSGCVLICQKS